MATATTTRRGKQAEQEARPSARERRFRDPNVLAFGVLWLGFIAAPLLAGIDKFFHWMTAWDRYLWPGFSDALPGSATQLLYVAGVVEIVAAIVVLLAPRIGGWLVATWLGGIITNLVILGVTTGEYWDIALRDLGLMLGAVALALLARRHGPRWPTRETVDLTS